MLSGGPQQAERAPLLPFRPSTHFLDASIEDVFSDFGVVWVPGQYLRMHAHHKVLCPPNRPAQQSFELAQ